MMKTLQSFKSGLLAASALAFTASATQALADQLGPYYGIPSWDQTLPASTRFIVLSSINSEAVLDRETGLVWEKAPGAIRADKAEAFFICMNKNVGSRGGWKLPSIQELRTLIDPTAMNLALPAGHPFTNVQQL